MYFLRSYTKLSHKNLRNSLSDVAAKQNKKMKEISYQKIQSGATSPY